MVCLVAALLPVAGVEAKEDPDPGLIAVSAGEVVALIDPVSGAERTIPAGPVAWLFPAPGGTLFAPDLVNGVTAVVDLATQTVRERIDGVTMPHFGTRTDRYLVVANQLLEVSYPERALLHSYAVAFENPWQVAVIAENTVLLVLERDPTGKGKAAMVAVNLSEGRMVYRRPLEGDVRHFALSPALAVIALSDASGMRVILTDPATLTTQGVFEVGGSPVDLEFVLEGTTLAVAAADLAGGGELVVWKIKGEKKHGLVQKKEWRIPLEGEPVRTAVSPDGRYVAVGLAEGRLQIIDVDSKVTVQSTDLPASPRDVVWCDPSVPGPLLPAWSDKEPPTLGIGG